MDQQIPIVVHPMVPPIGVPEGHEPTSAYVELFWLPVLGPTATWLWRRLASVTSNAAGPVAFDVADLAAQVGVKPVALKHTLERLVRFEFAHRWSLTTFAVPTQAPRVKYHQLIHLPASLQQAHAELEAREAVTV
jgi:hypothetical protein